MDFCSRPNERVAFSTPRLSQALCPNEKCLIFILTSVIRSAEKKGQMKYPQMGENCVATAENFSLGFNLPD